MKGVEGMKLSEEEVELFYRLFQPLIVYVNKKFAILEDMNSLADFFETPLQEIGKVRNKLYENPELFDSFVRDNPFQLTDKELEMVSSWKYFLQGKFVICAHLKKHTIFLGTTAPMKAYGVVGLKSTLEEVVGPQLPVMVDAVLLPFNGKIVYDSMLYPYSISFGSGIRRSVANDYQEAKSRFGIITSLPFSAEKVEQSDLDKLKFYLKSQSNREMYQGEIGKLIYKSHDLLTAYHQEMGKIHARRHGKQLHDIGITKGWFAILQGMTVAGGTTRNEVERIVQSVLPEGKRDFAYIFQLKG
jgi:hypothetical protein